MLATISLIFDTGLFVLLWLVQVVIYPSFQFYSRENLLRWHPKYTRLITFFAFPLMTGQLLLHLFQIWNTMDWVNISMVIFIIIGWIITFGKEVPYHNKVSSGENISQNIRLLIAWNWPRTISWTLVAILQFYHLQQL